MTEEKPLPWTEWKEMVDGLFIEVRLVPESEARRLAALDERVKLFEEAAGHLFDLAKRAFHSGNEFEIEIIGIENLLRKAMEK